MTDVPTENINFGLAHSFSLTTVPNLGSQCAYCKSTVLELQYYSCSSNFHFFFSLFEACKYTAHKKCIHLVPNTCASKGEKEGSVVKLPQKEIEKLYIFFNRLVLIKDIHCGNQKNMEKVSQKLNLIPFFVIVLNLFFRL